MLDDAYAALINFVDESVEIANKRSNLCGFHAVVTSLLYAFIANVGQLNPMRVNTKV